MNARFLVNYVTALIAAVSFMLVSGSSPIGAATSQSRTSCNSPSPCVQASNSGSGPGIEGVNTGSSSTAFRAGVEGLDGTDSNASLNNVGSYGNSRFGAGLAGQTTLGFGIFGTNAISLVHAENRVRSDASLGFGCTEAFTGRPCAVIGSDDESGRKRGTAGLFDSKNGLGLVGITEHPSKTDDFGAPGVLGEDLSLDSGGQDRGIEGDSYSGYGVIGFTFNPSNQTGAVKAGVLGIDDSLDSGELNAGVEAFSHGTGVLAVSFAAANPKGAAQHPAVLAICSGGGPAFIANDGTAPPTGDIASLDCAGNLVVSGTVVQNGSPLIKTGNPSGPQLVAYAGRSTRPTIEDDGEAQIVNGSASVAIDASFGATIDRRAPYLVFVTPDGPSQGLYVASKTPSGFVVREDGDGRSSLTFDYRIVALAAGAPQQRLPDVRQAMASLRAPVARRTHMPAGLTEPNPAGR